MPYYELWHFGYIDRRYEAFFCRFFADCPFRMWAVVAFVVLLLAGCGGTGSHTAVRPVVPIAAEHRQEVAMTALGLMGSPYRYGGTDPAQGFDCSGLVNYVFRNAAGAQLPRTTGHQAAVSRRINRRSLQPGDLVFFNTMGRANSHVGIYIGDGRFVNAPSSGGRVRIDTLDSPYFAKRFDSARTLFVQR